MLIPTKFFGLFTILLLHSLVVIYDRSSYYTRFLMDLAVVCKFRVHREIFISPFYENVSVVNVLRTILLLEMPDLRRSPTKVNFTHHNFTIWNDMLGEMMPVEVVHAKNVSVIHLIFSNVKRPIEPQYNLVFQQLLNTLKLDCIWFQNMKSKTCARSDVWRIS